MSDPMMVSFLSKNNINDLNSQKSVEGANHLNFAAFKADFNQATDVAPRRVIPTTAVLVENQMPEQETTDNESPLGFPAEQRYSHSPVRPQRIQKGDSFVNRHKSVPGIAENNYSHDINAPQSYISRVQNSNKQST